MPSERWSWSAPELFFLNAIEEKSISRLCSLT